MSNRSLKSSHGRPFSANRTHIAPPKTATDGRTYPEIKQRGYYSDILPNTTANELGVGFSSSTNVKMETNEKDKNIYHRKLLSALFLVL